MAKVPNGVKYCRKF